MKARDQYGAVLDIDPVILDLAPEDLQNDEIRAIDDLNWFEIDVDQHPELVRFRHTILVDVDKLACCLTGTVDFTMPADVGLKLPDGVSICHIGRALHRHERRTFYHA